MLSETVPLIPTATWIELVWTLIALPAVILSVVKLRRALGDQAALSDDAPDAEHEVAAATIRLRAFRLGKRLLYQTIGVAAMALPAGGRQTQEPVTALQAALTLVLFGLVVVSLVEDVYGEVAAARLRAAIERDEARARERARMRPTDTFGNPLERRQCS